MAMGTGEKLIEAAAVLLDQGGEAAVTLRAVAHQVGVSHNTPYKHFADRAALLAGVAEKDFATFSATFDDIGRSDRTAIEKVKAALEAFAAYGEAHPARYRLLFGDPVDLRVLGEVRVRPGLAAHGRVDVEAVDRRLLRPLRCRH